MLPCGCKADDLPLTHRGFILLKIFRNHYQHFLYFVRHCDLE